MFEAFGSLLLEESGGVVVVLELESELLLSSGQSRPCPAPAPVVFRVHFSVVLPDVVPLDDVPLLEVPLVDVSLAGPDSARRMLPLESESSLEEPMPAQPDRVATPTAAATANQFRLFMSPTSLG